MLFMGPVVGGGGLLAMMRTGERDLFFAALIPIGAVMWITGLWLKRPRTTGDKHGGTNPPT